MTGTKVEAAGTGARQAKVIEVAFYRSAAGNEPVRDWLGRLTKAERRLIGTAIKEAEYGWPIGLPVVRKMEAGLWEVRLGLTDQRIGRVLFTVDDTAGPATMVLLHGFVKKSRKTPKTDLAPREHDCVTISRAVSIESPKLRVPIRARRKNEQASRQQFQQLS